MKEKSIIDAILHFLKIHLYFELRYFNVSFANLEGGKYPGASRAFCFVIIAINHNLVISS